MESTIEGSGRAAASFVFEVATVYEKGMSPWLDSLARMISDSALSGARRDGEYIL